MGVPGGRPGFAPAGRRMRQELDVPGRDVVHRADDRDPTAPDEVAEGLALLDELLDDTRHVATRHGIDEGFLLEGRELLDGPALERVGQLLDLLHDVLEMLTARGLGDGPRGAGGGDARGRGAASG